MPQCSMSYRIVRRAGQQGTRPSVTSQAGVDTCATGCDSLSLSTRTSGTRTRLTANTNSSSTTNNSSGSNNLRIATINVRTLQDDIKLATIVKTASDLGIDVLAMQEVRRTSSGVFTFDDGSLKGWQLVWSGQKLKHVHGVGILLAPHVKLVDHQEYLPARIISATICVKGMRLAVLNVYAPTDSTKSDSAKSLFYAALSKAKIELDKNPKYKVMTLGDFNATISARSKDDGSWDQILGNNNSDRVETNNNGERMLTWCLKNQMKIINTVFRTKRIHRGTWRHAVTGRWKRVDYICTTNWVSKFIRSCRVFIGPSCLFDTDHRLLVMNMEFPNTKRELRYRLNNALTVEAKCVPDFQALRDSPEIQLSVTERLDSAFEGLEIKEMNELNERIVTTVRNCVEEACPKVNPTKKKEPWEDSILQQQLRDLRCCKKQKEIRKIQKAIKKRRRRLKNEYYRELADKINSAAEAREVEKEFAMAKRYTTLKSRAALSISNEKLKTHFENHFSVRELALPPELENPDQYPHLKDEVVYINEECPDEQEVKGVLKSFKNNKSAGTDKLKTEGLKYNESKGLLGMIVTLLTLIWTLVEVPTSWLHSSITCLFKKGLKTTASNYRGLSIGANMSRILSKIVINRFSHAYEEHLSEEQYGFRRNRSTSDGIFIVKTLTEKVGEPLIAVYIDLSAAYDHIPRDFLFRVLRIRTGADHLVAILQKLYEGTTASIRGMKSRFGVFVGCRQGGQESPCLFNYYFDYVLKVAASAINEEFPNGWGIGLEFNIPYLCTNREQRRCGRMRGVEMIRWILYADDAVLFCKTVREAEQLLTIINETCKRFGLTISFKKTKTQVFNDEELAKQPTLFSIGEHVVQNVREFVYLGQMVTNSKKGCFTEHRVICASAKFNELQTVLTDNNVNLRTRRKLLESYVRSRLIYGTQAWLPNEQQINKLEVCWVQFLRSMVKGGWTRKETSPEEDEMDYRFVYTNEQIQQIMKTMPLRDYIYSQHLKYVAHVCRAENTSLTKKILFAKPTKKYYRDPWLKISQLLGVSIDQAKRLTQSKTEFIELIRQRFSSAP